MNNLLFLGNIGAGEIVIVALVVLLRGLGKGVKNFKDGMKEIEKDIDLDADTDAKK